MGNVTSFSISSGASAGTCVLTCTWTLVMSGTASMGSRSADQTPMPTRTSVASATNVRWRTENSRRRLSIDQRSAAREDRGRRTEGRGRTEVRLPTYALGLAGAHVRMRDVGKLLHPEKWLLSHC